MVVRNDAIAAIHVSVRLPGQRRTACAESAPTVRADVVQCLMNQIALRIERLTRELGEELLQEYGAENAARMLEIAATEIRRRAEARVTRPEFDRLRVGRGLSRA